MPLTSGHDSTTPRREPADKKEAEKVTQHKADGSLVLLSEAATGQPVGVLDVAALETLADQLRTEIGSGPDAHRRMIAILDREADSLNMRSMFALFGLILRRGQDGQAVIEAGPAITIQEA